jgi:hypothetical protein
MVCARLYDMPGVGDPNQNERSGWGIIFEVDAGGSCPTALIYGRDPTPVKDAGKDQFVTEAKAYEYTNRLPPNGNGEACVKVLAPASGCDNQTITVIPYVPGDTEALCNPGNPSECYASMGRFPNRLDPSANINLLVKPSGAGVLTVSPDPASLNDGSSVQMTAMDSIDGNVTQNANTNWSIVSGDCTVENVAPNKGRVKIAERCDGTTCVVRAVYNPGVSRQDDATVNVTDDESGTWDTLTATVCSPSNDPVNVSASCTVPRRQSSADGCDRGAAVCTWSCTGDCGEVCADGTYSGTCTDGALNSSDGSTTIDNEYGTWDTLTATTCSPVNDGSNISCSTPRRQSSADGCDRGAAVCTWSCPAGCSSGIVTTELCMPTTTGAYTGRCTDGSQGVEDGSTVNNNETVPTVVDVTPNSPAPLPCAGTRDFACLATYADSCTEDCTTPGTWSTLAGCGIHDGGTAPNYRYTCPSSGATCNDTMTNTFRTVAGSENQQCNTCNLPSYKPYITTVFPLNLTGIPARNYSNAHAAGQDLTVVLSQGATAGVATSVTATCVAAGDSSTESFSCSLAGYPADPDVPCTITTAPMRGSDKYRCTVTASNSNGSSNVQGFMWTAMSSSPVDGGFAGGYVGGNLWDSATNKCNSGNVVIRAISAAQNAQIAGKAYVQIIQGNTVDEWFTNASGQVTVPLLCQPIKELTIGYKCGLATCPKVEDGATLGQYRTGNTNNFRYMTYRDLDANDIGARLELMTSSLFNRWKQRITGTIAENYFTNYIYARPAGPRLRQIFVNPVKLRAAFVLVTLAGIQEAASSLDMLLLAPDYEVSISLCVLPRDNVGAGLAAALPPNLVIPELARQTWAGSSACAAWGTNPGKYYWEYWVYQTNTYKNVWSLGAYANATNFSLSGGIDLFAFPIYVCGLGMRGGTTPGSLVGDPFLRTGNQAGFRYDLRENWTNNPLGYDPDTAVDRKFLVSIRGRALPLDPARQNATLRYFTYRVPNISDSELVADATWDDRFYRKSAVVISGADFGVAAGLGVTGLSLNNKIDDPSFTMFMVGYMQSSTSQRMGNRDLRYWSGSTSNTDTIQTQHAGINSTWTDPSGTNIDFTALVDGGPTNYAVISVLTRGSALDGRSTDTTYEKPDLAISLGGFAPGSILGVWHIGKVEQAGNETIPVNDFLNLPIAQAPGPDEYVYPGPQWSNTIRGSAPQNRNAELWRVPTVGTADAIPRVSGGRYYFQFSRPTFMYASSRAIHTWLVTLSETATYTGFDSVSNRAVVQKLSLKSRVYDDDGYCTATNEFNDNDARYQNWGVAAGDTLLVESRKYAAQGQNPRRYLITSVPTQTRVVTNGSWGSANNLPSGCTTVRYRIIRANKRAECIIDGYFGGGPSGYGCKSNRFWDAQGPANTNPIRVYIPAVTSGPRTLHGATGVVPEFWDGIPTGTQLEWGYDILVFNTGALSTGGLGGPFDWNNWESRKDELSTQHGALDAALVLYQ